MEIQELNKQIRKESTERIKAKVPEQVSTSWYNEDLLYSGKGKSLFIILATEGCSWALGPSGGCTMCSYINDCTQKPVESSKIIELFKKELEKHPYKEDFKSGDKIAIKIFASGSFLNPKEVPKEARDEILKILSENEEFSEIVVESRPEYVSEDVIEEVFNIIGDKLFEISMGLETLNDKTRLYNINKGFTLKDFENAVDIIKKMKEKGYNIKSKPYIFLKPILLSEKESIDEAIETGIYCNKIGVDRLSYCPATIHGGTLIERLWRENAYKPPWIWSAVEVINRIRDEVSIPSLMDTSAFGSRRGPYNCKKCNKDIKHLIIKTNLSQDKIDYDCECKNKWKAEVESEDFNYSKTKINHLPLY